MLSKLDAVLLIYVSYANEKVIKQEIDGLHVCFNGLKNRCVSCFVKMCVLGKSSDLMSSFVRLPVRHMLLK